jgi:hypothetical protein
MARIDGTSRSGGGRILEYKTDGNRMWMWVRPPEGSEDSGDEIFLEPDEHLVDLISCLLKSLKGRLSDLS